LITALALKIKKNEKEILQSKDKMITHEEKQSDYKNEAKYYLESNDYDIDKAMDEYNKDVKAEEELMKK